MSNEPPTPNEAPSVCSACGRRLMPMSFEPVSTDSDPVGVEDRLDLKCPGCGQGYQLADSASGTPIDPVA
jgi:uncharacterized protein with PIN domain